MSASSEEIRSRITGEPIPEGHVIVGLWQTAHLLRLYVESSAGLREWRQVQTMSPFKDALEVKMVEKNPHKGGLFNKRIQKDEKYFNQLTHKAEAGSVRIRMVPENEVETLLQSITENKRTFTEQKKFIRKALFHFPVPKAPDTQYSPPHAL